MEMKSLLKKVNDQLEHYEVQLTTDLPIICEDGQYRKRHGYAVYNKVSDVYEHTTTLLPGAIFQAQHLDATLVGLLTPEAATAYSLEDIAMEDVVAN